MKIAVGYRRHASSDLRRVVVSFDSETFAQVRRFAQSENCSFAEAVRLLVEFGLEAG